MEKYHIGRQIHAKIYQTDKQPEQVAREIGIQRQSLYDIFNSESIKTSRLMDLCKALNYDFFSDLSTVFNHGRDRVISESDADFNCTLIRKDELRIFSLNYLFDEVVERYGKAETDKPLVMFFAEDSRDTAEEVAARIVKKDESIKTMIYDGNNYSKALEEAKEMMQTSGQRVALIIPVINDLRRGVNGGLVYEDVAEDMFRLWRDEAHAIAVKSGRSAYQRRREYYRAYLGDGLFDRLARQFTINDEIEQQLFELSFGYDFLSPTVLISEDKTGYSRIKLSYPAPDKALQALLYDNGVNNSPHLDMWIDIRNNMIIDYQYRNLRTSSL